MTTTADAPKKSSVRVQVQKFGTFLSGMIMPNIPALIAWGIVTMFFIPDGFTPNADIATIVGPMIHYLLPIIIAYTGGHMVYGNRGAVVASIGTIGAIAGSDFLIAQQNALLLEQWLAQGNPEADFKELGQVHMFIGAMIMAPVAAYSMKWLDGLWENKIKAGLEMLVNMFSAGIWGFVLLLVGFFPVAWLVNGIMNVLSGAVNWLVANNLLPLTSIIIEPAKVFFLNNAINHGVLTPLGTQEAADSGRSILFLLEANPGPGLGLLLAFAVFGLGAARASAPGAAFIQFVGGIHEVYFPYALMKPTLILALIGGGMTGVATNMVLGGALRVPAAPGSILAVLAQTAPGAYFAVGLSVVLAAAVTFLIAAVILRASRKRDLAAAEAGDDKFASAISQTEANKGKKSSALAGLAGGGSAAPSGPVKSIVFACDAGMGSSAMGASVLRKKIQAAGFSDVTVVNKAISNLTDTYDVVVSHEDLMDRATQPTPSAVHVAVDNFMASPRYDEVVEMVRRSNSGDAAEAEAEVESAPAEATPAPAAPAAPAAAEAAAPAAAEQTPAVDDSESLLKVNAIVLDGTAGDRNAAITEAGDLLVASGTVDSAYVDSMHERERSVSTYMGNLLAIPHGTNEAKALIQRSAISVVRYPGGIDWNGNPVKFVIGIAGAGNDHLELLGKVAEVFLDDAKIAELEAATTPEQIWNVFGNVGTSSSSEPAAPAPEPAPEPTPAPAAPAVAEEVPQGSGEVLDLSSIVLDGKASDRNGAITEAGDLLVASGNVDGAYVESMHERERSVSTYMGNLLAIPHGTNEAKSLIRQSSISVVRYPGGIDWNGNPVKFVIGIAGAGNDHLELLGKIAEVFLDESKIAELEAATTPEQIRDAFGGVNG